MSDFDDDDGLSSVSSPTLSDASYFDCEENDGFDEATNAFAEENDKNIQREHTIVISSSNSSSTLSIGDGNPAQQPINDCQNNNDVSETVIKEIGRGPSLLHDSIDIDSNGSRGAMPSYYDQNNFIPTGALAVNNMDQINNHMEHCNLKGSNSVNNIPGTVIPGSFPMTSSMKYSAQVMNRPSAIIRPNIHAPSTSKGTGFATQYNRVTTIRKHKRPRTAFNCHQLMGLEKEYSKIRYIDSKFRANLANELSLSEKSIKVWFQNRRMKEKKDMAGEEIERTELNDSSKSKIINDNGGYQFPRTVNFNQESNQCNTLPYPTTQSYIQPAVNMNNLIIPNYSVYVPNTQNYQTPIINQFYQMTSPQLQHQQPCIQMQQQVFQPQQIQIQNQQMQFQQIQHASIQQLPVQQIISPIQVQQIPLQKYLVPSKTENVINNSEDNKTMITRLTFEDDSL